ncbi:hypothetical protein H4I96_02548 [Botrytis cinerea]
MDLQVMGNPPATSSYDEMQIDIPAASFVAIQDSSKKAETVGGSMPTPPETPFPRSMELSTRQSVHSLSAQPLPDLIAKLLFCDPQSKFLPTYQPQLHTSSSTVREHIHTSSRFLAFAVRLLGNVEDVSQAVNLKLAARACLMEELERYPFSRMGNPMKGNPATEKTAIDKDKETQASSDSDATISAVGDY